VERAADGLRLEVSDDGRGMAPGAEPGKGLVDVRERLEACGGRLDVTASRGGTVVVASVPSIKGEVDAVDRRRR
jgi:signal transduction histidine kinase